MNIIRITALKESIISPYCTIGTYSIRGTDVRVSSQRNSLYSFLLYYRNLNFIILHVYHDPRYSQSIQFLIQYTEVSQYNIVYQTQVSRYYQSKSYISFILHHRIVHSLLFSSMNIKIRQITWYRMYTMTINGTFQLPKKMHEWPQALRWRGGAGFGHECTN